MLNTAIHSLLMRLREVLPAGMLVVYHSPDTQPKSWVELVVDSAPTPFDEFGEKNNAYTAEISITARAIVQIGTDGIESQSLIHNAIESAIQGLASFTPEGAQNLVQQGASGIDVEGGQAENLWYKCTLNYTLTFSYR